MKDSILIISSAPGVRENATVIAEQLQTTIELASGRRAGLAAARRNDYSIVIVDETLAESDPAWADLLWQNAGVALPMQYRFGGSGVSRLIRELRSLLARRQREIDTARRAAMASLESELKSSVAGLLLHSELALREPAVPASLAPRLQHLVELAGAIREQLRPRIG